MARFSRSDVLNSLLDTGLLPVFYHVSSRWKVERSVAMLIFRLL